MVRIFLLAVCVTLIATPPARAQSSDQLGLVLDSFKSSPLSRYQSRDKSSPSQKAASQKVERPAASGAPQTKSMMIGPPLPVQTAPGNL
jgi:hypothetical protein